MTLYNITVAVTYECHGPNNELYQQDSTLYLIVEGNSPDDDFTSQIEAEVEANRPNNCAGRPIYSYTVESSDLADHSGPELTPDELTEPIAPDEIGQLVTFEGAAFFVCADGSNPVRTVQADLFSTATVEEVLAALEDVALGLTVEGDSAAGCSLDHVELVGPTYYFFNRD